MKRFYALGAAILSAVAQAGTGTYEVPVKAEVSRLNVFLDAGTIQKEADGVTRLRYVLPKEISGETETHIVMTLQSTSLGILHFAQTAPKGEASCIRFSGHVKCVSGYDPKIVRLEDAESFLRQKFAGDPRLQERLNVASVFSHEAIGILSFDEE